MVWKKHMEGEWRAFTMVKEHHIRTKSVILTTLAALILYGVPAWSQEDYEARVQKAVLKADWARVAEIAREWQKSNAESAVAPWLLGYSCLARGDYETATQGFMRLAEPKTTDQVLSWAKMLADQNPQSAVAQMLKGDALARTSRYEEALKTLDKAIQLSPDSTLARHVRGTVRALTGRMRDALSDIQEVISQNQNFADAHANLGIVYLSLHEFRKADQCFTKAISLDLKYALAYNGRALSAWYSGRHETAISDLEMAVTLLANNPIVISNLAIVRREKAKHDLRSMIAKVDPDKRGGVIRSESTLGIFGTGINVEAGVDYALDHARCIPGSSPINERWAYVAFKGAFPLTGVEKVHLRRPDWKAVMVDPGDWQAGSQTLDNFVSETVRAGKQPRIYIDINKWLPQQIRLDGQDKTINIPAQLAANANKVFTNELTKLNMKGTSYIAGHSDFTWPLNQATQKAHEFGCPFNVALVESNRSETWLKNAVSSCPQTQFFNIQPKAGDFWTREAQWRVNPKTAYQETLKNYRQLAKQNSNYTLVEINRLEGLGRLFAPGVTHSDPTKLNTKFDVSIFRRRSDPLSSQSNLKELLQQEFRAVTPNLGRSLIPTYSTFADRPLTEASAMASMLNRGLGSDISSDMKKAYIVGADEARYKAMANRLKGWDIRRVGNMAQIDPSWNPAAILSVKQPEPLRDISSHRMFDATRVPIMDFRLPSSALPGDKRGGVAMKADVVKGKPADMSGIFGSKASEQTASQQEGLVCPFLLFCAMPSE